MGFGGIALNAGFSAAGSGVMDGVQNVTGADMAKDMTSAAISGAALGAVPGVGLAFMGIDAAAAFADPLGNVLQKGGNSLADDLDNHGYAGQVAGEALRGVTDIAGTTLKSVGAVCSDAATWASGIGDIFVDPKKGFKELFASPWKMIGDIWKGEFNILKSVGKAIGNVCKTIFCGKKKDSTIGLEEDNLGMFVDHSKKALGRGDTAGTETEYNNINCTLSKLSDDVSRGKDKIAADIKKGDSQAMAADTKALNNAENDAVAAAQKAETRIKSLSPRPHSRPPSRIKTETSPTKALPSINPSA